MGNLRLRVRLLSVIGLLLLTLCAPCAFAQTAYAPGGLFVDPTAFTPREGQWNLYAAFFDQYEIEGKEDHYAPVNVIYSPTNSLEVSFLTVYHDGFGHPHHFHLGGFVKYQFIPDAPRHPAIAWTAAYVGRDHMQWSSAAVVSHAFLNSRGRASIIPSVGVKWGSASEDATGTDFAGFVGLQVPVGHGFQVIGEESTKFKFDRGCASGIGASWTSRTGTTLTLGYVNTGRSIKPGFFFGVGVALGGLK